MEEKKLFLLDAYALIYRAYYALLHSPRTTSSGMNTSAVFGFCNTLDEILKKENPSHIAVCFDPSHGRTFRHEKYPDYKAGRDKQPEDITLSVPYIKSILAAHGIAAIEVEGYEADDVIGTLSRRAEAQGFTTYMMTPDKDYGQLVTDHVFMYRPAIKGKGFEIRGPEQICERYGISSPKQVIDLLALEGDASDNVPGCPGVGEKTAAKLIARFGSVEELLDNTDSLSGALQKRIRDNAAQIRMSKDLVTIETDVPLETDLESLRRTAPDIEALTAVYRELEFKTFIDRLGTSKTSVQPPKSLFGDDDDLFAEDGLFAEAERVPAPISEHQEITDIASMKSFIDRVIASGEAGLAVDASGAESMTATIHGVALAIRDEERNVYESAYFPFPSEAAGQSEYGSELACLLSSDVILCGDDIKRSMLILRRLGAEFAGAKWFDTAVAHYLCDPEKKHDLPTLAMSYTSQMLWGYDGAKGRPLDVSAEMCAYAAAALRLKPLLMSEVKEKGQTELLEKVELPLTAVLADMEYEGVRVDPTELQRLAGELRGRLNALEEKAAELAGRPFNAGSPLQVGQILFDELKIDPKARKTKGGAWSTAEDVLEKYAPTVPLVQIILDIRGLRKLLTTYVEALPKLINPHTGKIHTTYNQTVTSTGRISSTNPNLQNIPIRSTDGRDIRRAFISDPGCLLLSADYSQIELRLMADMSGDPAMIEAFVSGEDIHRATAAKIYHTTVAEVTDNQRRNAKTANFGIIYGISAFGLSERLSIPRSEAQALIAGYLATYPRVAEYMQESIDRARRDGFVTTVMGRRRYLPDINSRSNTVRSYAERNAINAPLQGSAADIIKSAMVSIYSEMSRRGLKSKMILQVHDELIFNIAPEELSEMQQIVTEGMENAWHGRVPMEVAAGVATNWLDAH